MTDHRATALPTVDGAPTTAGPWTEHRRVRDGVALRLVRWSAPTGGVDSAPIILVHGLASNARLWDGAARALADLGHGVVAIDLRGHGLSDKPDHGYDIASVATDVMDIADSLADDDDPAWRRPLVIGQSWGGNIVIHLADRFGARVRGVVAVDGGTIDLARAFASWEECERTLSPPHLAGMEASRLRSYIRAAHPDWSEEAIDGQMHNMEHLDDGTIRPWLSLERHLAILRGMWDAPPSRHWDAIEVPVLFTPAARTDDDHTRLKRAQIDEAVRRIDRCRVEWFEPADHDLHAQHPVRFASVVHSCVTEGFFR